MVFSLLLIDRCKNNARFKKRKRFAKGSGSAVHLIHRYRGPPSPQGEGHQRGFGWGETFPIGRDASNIRQAKRCRPDADRLVGNIKTRPIIGANFQLSSAFLPSPRGEGGPLAVDEVKMQTRSPSLSVNSSLLTPHSSLSFRGRGIACGG